MKPVMFIVPLILFATGVCAQEDQQNQEFRSAIIAKFKSLPDDKLKQSFETLLSVSRFRDDPSYEPCLNEIVRRGGKTWEAFLSAKLETLNKKQIKLGEDIDDTVPGSHYNLELLTALCRLQKKPDPLVVMLDEKGPLEATPLGLPKLKVKIKNLDGEKTTAGFRNSGDYGSGRQARWRIVVRDGKGTELPARGPLTSGHGGLVLFMGGGQYQEDVLKYGESWETVLDVGSFVKIPQPGTYSLEVLYHNTKAIADESDISGLIVSRAKPITLIVRPVVIELTAQERKQAAQWIAALNANQRVKVVVGTYGEWAHKFVPPTTPEGRLLGMGIKAVPTLIESLADKSLSEKKRAWILSLLFSATSENDPCDTSVLGEYDYREGGWQVWGSKSGEGASGGLRMPDEGSASDGKIDPKFMDGLGKLLNDISVDNHVRKIDREAQNRLIGVWQQWFKSVQVRQGTSIDRPKPAATSNTR